jgi:hypothetical protein
MPQFDIVKECRFEGGSSAVFRGLYRDDNAFSSIRPKIILSPSHVPAKRVVRRRRDIGGRAAI